MAVKIGHASINEKGTVKGGKKGDQTGKEVCTTTWYLHKKGWYVLRPKNPKDAEKIAATMEAICKNDNFGYGQDYRNSGFNELEKVNFKPEKVKTKCGLDCSKTVMACCYAAGIKNGNFTTANQKDTLMKTNKFELLTSDTYCKSSKYLKRGDILVTRTSGHTIVILSNGSAVNEEKVENKNNSNSKYKESKVKVAKYFSKAIVGTYKTIDDLNLRYGAGTLNEKIITMPKGSKVRCYGYYNKVLKTKWFLVEYNDYVGYCSSSYLK